MHATRRSGYLLLIAVVAFAGCGDDGNSNSGSTTPLPSLPMGPTLPSQSEISVEVLGAGFVATGQGNATVFELRMEESAGLGANINFIRIDLFRATGEFEERSEIGAGTIEEQTGSNRLDADETREITPFFFFRATVKSGRQVRLTVGFTDDMGNDLEWVADFTFP